MRKTKNLGKYFYLMAIIGLSIVQLVVQHLHPGLFPVSAGVAENAIIVNLSGLLLLVSAVLAFTPKWQRYGTITIGLFFLLTFLFVHVPKLVGDIHNGGEWTVAFEVLALACGAFIVFETNTSDNNLPAINGFLKWAAYYLFALSLLVFGGLHFVYNDFIVTLIPAWMPGKLVLAYLVMAGFFAAALSLIIKLWVKQSMSLLSAMFFVWVLVLHLPRVALAPRVEAEWASMFIALGMSGIALIIAMHVHSLMTRTDRPVIAQDDFKAVTE